MSSVFRLVRDEGGASPVVVFEDSTTPGFVPLWEEVGVYDALYNSDGKHGRDVSRALAYGLDRVMSEPGLNRLVPVSALMAEAIRFLENVNRGCITHGAAWIQTR